MVVGATVGSTGLASAQYTNPPPSGGAATDSQAFSRPPGSGGGSQGTGGQSLPITGGDVLGLTAIGVAAIASGTALVRFRRRSGS